MNKFIFQSTPKLIFGCTSINALKEEILLLKCKNVFFICDPIISEMQFFKNILTSIKADIKIVGIFTDIISDPGFDVADKATKQIQDSNADIIVGIGGGSTLDIAKIIKITAKTKESAKTLVKNQVVTEKGLPLILIPTTAGTGSEVTHISILSDNDEKLKTGLVNPNLYADIAILDPDITLSLPKNITAFSGIDAIIHALEALTSKKAHSMSNFIAIEALGILHKNILPAFNDGNNLEARSNMLYGSMLAGQAFANSSVAAIHAFAYPIGAEFHIPHGLANSIMLMPILKFNLENGIGKYKLAAKAIGIETTNKSEQEIADSLISTFDKLLRNLEIDRNLKHYGVKESDIPRLAKSVMKITRLLDNNPRKINLADAEKSYKEAL